MLIIHYEQTAIRSCESIELSSLLKAKEGVVWVDLDVGQPDDVKILTEQFSFHPLALEDVMHGNQRPKAENFTDHLFLILNPINTLKSEELFRELNVFVNDHFIVTTHFGNEPIIEEAHQRIERHHPAFVNPTSYLLYVLIDTVIDGYMPILESIEETIEDLSNEALHKPHRKLLETIAQFKHQLNVFWWVVFPQQDILHFLEHHETLFAESKSRYYLRDVSDHLARIMNVLQSSRDTINGLVNIYMSAVSNRLNLAVGRLTILTIVIGIFAVYSGFYGMNFLHTFPPYDAPWGVPAVIGFMFLTSVAVAIVMRWGDFKD